ncbi:MAG: HD domain-containing protein [Actinomycetota bacterium]
MDNAFRLAESQHRYQLRKGTKIPYISHLMAVASLVLEHGGTQEQAKAALLHDVIEDTGLTYDELRDVVGTAVADIVQNCTHVDEPEKTDEAWKRKKQHYLDRLISDGRIDKDTLADFVLITLADKTHNVESTLRDVNRDGKSNVFERFNVGYDLQKWWYSSLAAAFETLAVSRDEKLRPLLERFLTAISEIFPQS